MEAGIFTAAVKRYVAGFSSVRRCVWRLVFSQPGLKGTWVFHFSFMSLSVLPK